MDKSHFLKYGLRTEKGQAKEDNFLCSLPFFIVFLFLFKFPLYKYKSFNGASLSLPLSWRVPSISLQSVGNNTPESVNPSLFCNTTILPGKKISSSRISTRDYKSEFILKKRGFFKSLPYSNIENKI